MRPFRGRFFRPRGIFEEGRISGFWGDLAGFAASRDLITRARTSRETGGFLAFPLFRGENLTFRVYGVDYMAFLKNYPIPQEVKGMADGDSLRQLFFFFGLDFRVCAWYCTALLSDAGDVPVPVCRWFRTCFHRLF